MRRKSVQACSWINDPTSFLFPTKKIRGGLSRPEHFSTRSTKHLAILKLCQWVAVSFDPTSNLKDQLQSTQQWEHRTRWSSHEFQWLVRFQELSCEVSQNISELSCKRRSLSEIKFVSSLLNYNRFWKGLLNSSINSYKPTSYESGNKRRFSNQWSSQYTYIELKSKLLRMIVLCPETSVFSVTRLMHNNSIHQVYFVTKQPG